MPMSVSSVVIMQIERDLHRRQRVLGAQVAAAAVALRVEARRVDQPVCGQVVRLAVLVPVVGAHGLQQQIRPIRDQPRDAELHELVHLREVVHGPGDHRIARLLERSDVEDLARGGPHARALRRLLARGDEGRIVAIDEQLVHRREDGRFGPRGLRVRVDRVHHPHRAALFAERALGAAQLGLAGQSERKRRLQHLAGGVGVDQKRPELVAEPQRAVGSAAHGLDVQVRAGEDALLGEEVADGEGEVAVGIAQLEEVQDLDGAAAAVGLARLGADSVDAQVEVRGVLQRAVAVVGHGQVHARLRRGDQRREALHRLARKGQRLAVHQAAAQARPGGGTGRERRRGQGRVARQPDRALAGGAGRGCRDKTQGEQQAAADRSRADREGRGSRGRRGIGSRGHGSPP
jgi:hypothetical protein